MKLRSPRPRRGQTPLSLPSPSPAEGPGRGWQGRTVVVGLRRDAAGRELLAWALAKVAAAGDRVVALHVATAAADDFQMEKMRASDSLASVLRAYDAFCNLKQISLELRVCQGSSIKKALVSEASSCGAAHLVLGVTKNTKHFGSSATAVAKYCAKRVPQSCSVLAVSNGRVVYHRNTARHELNDHSTMVETPRRIYRQILDAAVMVGEKARDDSALGGARPFRRSLSVSASAPVSPAPARCRNLTAAGWPLLKKDIVPDLRPASPARSEMSVVQWAMQLPIRCSPANNPDRISGDHRAAAPSLSEPGHPSPVAEEAAKQVQVSEELVSIRDKYSSMYTMFSHGELAKITSNFSPERVVGKGGASQVYMGCSEEDGRELAVKVLRPSTEAVEEFVAEVEITSALHHRNAMSLVGFCLDGGDLMLVFDYMRRGSLEELLHGGKGGCGGGVGGRFGWPERFKVAVGVARALGYLHGGGDHPPVIHRDVKSSNILVSEDFEPKLCDFGLALWASDAAAQITGDDVAGTFGYLAPEYFMHGKVSEKMDVYAFGVVLLELISGRKPVSAGGPKGQESLVMWANSVVQGGKLAELVDGGSLPEDGNGEVVERMALAACLCVTRAPQRRPSIANVLELLDGDGDGDAVRWARSLVGVSSAGGEDTPPEKNDIQSYINLALLGVGDDDSASVGSADFVAANMSLEKYMKGRWSRSSSFD